MKTLIIAFLVMISGTNKMVKYQEMDVVNATFNNFENGIYSFTDKDGYSIEFAAIAEDVLKSYDLTDAKYKGIQFSVTYMNEEVTDTDGTSMFVEKIMKLKMLE